MGMVAAYPSRVPDHVTLPPDPAAEPASMVVRVDTGERIHYLDWGNPRAEARPLPPLLLVHGVAQTGWTWAPVARRLCGLTRVLAMDLRGHGLSDVPRSGYAAESLAWDALTVLTGAGLGRDAEGPPAVVAGHGLGAMVAATMAGLAPTSIAGVALVDGGWEDLGDATRQSPDELLAALAEPPEVLASMEAFLVDRRAFDPATWDADQERAARAQVDQKHAGHVGLVARPVVLRGLVAGMFAYDPIATLITVESPLLVLVAETGGADDDMGRERRLALADVERERARAGRSPARIVRYPGAGHNLMRHRAAAVSAELLSLLEEAAGEPTAHEPRP
jgi:pimeloyl-ACP methyl ester carboxylesterase